MVSLTHYLTNIKIYNVFIYLVRETKPANNYLLFYIIEGPVCGLIYSHKQTVTIAGVYQAVEMMMDLKEYDVLDFVPNMSLFSLAALTDLGQSKQDILDKMKVNRFCRLDNLYDFMYIATQSHHLYTNI